MLEYTYTYISDYSREREREREKKKKLEFSTRNLPSIFDSSKRNRVESVHLDSNEEENYYTIEYFIFFFYPVSIEFNKNV